MVIYKEEDRVLKLESYQVLLETLSLTSYMSPELKISGDSDLEGFIPSGHQTT